MNFKTCVSENYRHLTGQDQDNMINITLFQMPNFNIFFIFTHCIDLLVSYVNVISRISKVGLLYSVQWNYCDCSPAWFEKVNICYSSERAAGISITLIEW